MSTYIDLSYRPSNDDVVCLFRVEPAANVSFEKAVDAIAAESSIGTWTDVGTMSDELRERLRPHAFQLDPQECLVKIAYPGELFEDGNVPQIMSSIAGNIYGMRAVENLRLLDFTLPERIIRSYAGPSYGISGVRRILNVSKRPLVGTIIKPKVGLPPGGHAKVAYESWVGGCDIVKDDENLTNQKFNPFEERIPETLKMLDRAVSETGEKKVYMPNVTAETEEMLKRMDYVKQHGGKYVMLDVVTIGFSALQTARKHAEKMGLVLHAHRAMHAALTRNKKHGITMLALAKLYRLIGVDQLHVGTAVGKMEGPAAEVQSIIEEIKQQDVPEDGMRLSQKWHNLRPVMPVCSGGLHAGHVPDLIKITGMDVVIQAGGGVHGHPDGTIAGAKSMRQAVEAVLNDTTLEEYAKTHAELSRALEKFSR
jgi:ribulose-bisphosphate carboxylase large chain